MHERNFVVEEDAIVTALATANEVLPGRDLNLVNQWVVLAATLEAHALALQTELVWIETVVLLLIHIANNFACWNAGAVWGSCWIVCYLMQKSMKDNLTSANWGRSIGD